VAGREKDGLQNISVFSHPSIFPSLPPVLPTTHPQGGVALDPRSLSAGELERVTRKLVGSFHRMMGPLKDIPGPELSAGSRVMAWWFDAASKYDGFSPACVTGKPLDLHGTHGRESATGKGAVIAARELLAASGEGGLAGKTFAIQGYGNVGSWAAAALHEAGARVVAVSDRDGCLINEAGLDVPALRRHVRAAPPFGGSLSTFPGGTTAPRGDLFTVRADVLIPAAVAGALDARTAAAVAARYVVEAANAPTTPAGDAVLRERGIPVLPDIYASGGGVMVSFLEWVQNQMSYRMEEGEVASRLEAGMCGAFRSLWATAQARGLPLRTAAFVEALQRVTQAHLHRGFD
jgi:glutamate dehydrogenase (NAD(P)+)